MKKTMEARQITKNVFLCNDGKYRWLYEVPLLKTPVFLFMVWKIFFFILLGVFAFVFLISLFDGTFPAGLGEFAKAFLIGMLVMTAVVSLGYLIYAATMRGKYTVIFEMDEEGINHRQIPSQAKKAETISALTVAAAIASGSFGAASAGSAAAKTSMYTSFEKVRKIKAYPSLHLIKVNERLSHNQVYAEKEDFDFVLNYLKEHSRNIKSGK